MEKKHRGEHFLFRREGSPSPLSKITDEQLFLAIACPGFLEHFNENSLVFKSKYVFVGNPKTHAYMNLREAEILDKQGRSHRVIFGRDRRNRSIMVFDQNNQPIIGLRLRDRKNDGKPSASSPVYLRRIGHRKARDGGHNGLTDWYYSSQVDKTPFSGVEISILSSNSAERYVESLLAKHESGRLYQGVDGALLARFIDDPFLAIPKNPSKERLDIWWKYFFQVVNRGFRNKQIPYPGQGYKRGFSGYFPYVVERVREMLEPLGYEKISGVPTWVYVMEMFKKQGFIFDNQTMEKQCDEFINRLNKIQIPEIFVDKINASLINDLPLKSPLRSWLAVAAYVIAKNPDYVPDENTILPKQFLPPLIDLVKSLKEQLIREDGSVSVYPLRPGKNLWMSMKI